MDMEEEIRNMFVVLLAAGGGWVLLGLHLSFVNSNWDYLFIGLVVLGCCCLLGFAYSMIKILEVR